MLAETSTSGGCKARVEYLIVYKDTRRLSKVEDNKNCFG